MDLFVLGESRHTFSGNEKPLHFQENAERFSSFPVARVEIPFKDGIAREREFFSRDYMCREGIPGGSPDDIILIGDIDEIPSAAGVRRARELLDASGAQLISWRMYFSYYYVNMWDGGGGWDGTVAARRRHFLSGQAMGDLRGKGTRIEDGWHLSYLGGSGRIREKIESFCDTQYNDEKYKNLGHLDECLEEGSDLFFRGDTYHYRPVDSSFPAHLVANQDRFAHLIKAEPPAVPIDSTPCAEPMRINLGSGNTRYAGFTNVDITTKVDVDLIGSALDIPAPDKSVAVLYHNAVFEHIFVAQHRLALQEADRVLAPGGVHIALGIPDFQTIARLYLEAGPGLVGPRFRSIQRLSIHPR